MDASRVDVEHVLGLASNQQKRNNTHHTSKLLMLRERTRHHLFTIYFFTNVHATLRGNKSSTKYNLPSPTCIEHLSTDDTYYHVGDDADDFIMGTWEHGNMGTLSQENHND